MTMKPLVYIAAPYTKPDPVQNSRNAIAVAERIEAMGVDVVIPHLTLMWHLVSPAPYERWLERDSALLQRCDGLIRWPGESSGADAEVRLAHIHDIPVYEIHPLLGTDSPEFRAWVEGLRPRVAS